MTGAVVPPGGDRCPVHGWARPEHYDEARDRPCPGWTEYHPGDLDAACDTCGGRTGWRVAGPLSAARPVVPPGGEDKLRDSMARELFEGRHGDVFHHPRKGDLHLWEWSDSHGFWEGQRRRCYSDVDHLLPTVLAFAEEQGRRRAAEELRAGADVPLKACCPEHASKRLRARAAALAPENARPE